MVARPVRRRSLPIDVSDQLLELIAAAGAPELLLPAERELSEQLQVSRNVLREALAALEGIGAVEVRGRSRVGIVPRARTQLVARVPTRGPESELAVDPIEARDIFEPEVAALAAMRATPTAISEIERWLTLMEEGVARGERVVEYDAAFHVAVARATGNHTLVEVIGALNDAVGHSREHSFKAEGSAQGAIAHHHMILTAIRERDADGARLAMRVHLEHVGRSVREALREQRLG
ncbi:MAG: GntR family transcriptional regulator, transcriptional repressor for pyruvate dehydrogenase complex [Gaiellales bacterium]|nr:GntR family transcriptional regulator, transcriptional repressor for pyruvate dehydrogenase complex [Gaiellales bacterium]